MKSPGNLILRAFSYSGTYMILGTVYFSLLGKYESLGQSSFFVTFAGVFFPALLARPSSFAGSVEGSFAGVLVGTALYGVILSAIFLAIRYFRIRNNSS